MIGQYNRRFGSRFDRGTWSGPHFFCRFSNNFFHLSNNFSPVFERKTTAPKEGSAT